MDNSRMVLVTLLVSVLASGCSIKRFAINKLGDALAHGGTTFTSDDDPDLIKSATPFSLKLIESLLSESPHHKGLLVAAASGFTEYSYAFVQQDADESEDQNLETANALRVRARRLYLRARNYGLRGLETEYPGFEKALREDPKRSVNVVRVADVPLLYWTAISWAAAISIAKDNPDLVADLPKVEALIERALELEEAFGNGAIHSFLIAYEISRQGPTDARAARARKHFDRAMQLSIGQQASPLVSLAESVSVREQNLIEFKSLLNRALAINPDARPEWRLLNLVMQRRARWLLARSDQLFLISETNEK